MKGIMKSKIMALFTMLAVLISSITFSMPVFASDSISYEDAKLKVIRSLQAVGVKITNTATEDQIISAMDNIGSEPKVLATFSVSSSGSRNFYDSLPYGHKLLGAYATKVDYKGYPDYYKDWRYGELSYVNISGTTVNWGLTTGGGEGSTSYVRADIIVLYQ